MSISRGCEGLLGHWLRWGGVKLRVGCVVRAREGG